VSPAADGRSSVLATTLDEIVGVRKVTIIVDRLRIVRAMETMTAATRIYSPPANSLTTEDMS
jgi:hypothetical protein